MTVERVEAEQDPILSAKVVEELRSIGGFHEIASEFLVEAPMRITAIRQAFAEKRLDAIMLQAHALKGASGAAGAIRLSRASAKLEIASRTNSEEQLVALIEGVVAEIEIARLALLEMMAIEAEEQEEQEEVDEMGEGAEMNDEDLDYPFRR